MKYADGLIVFSVVVVISSIFSESTKYISQNSSAFLHQHHNNYMITTYSVKKITMSNMGNIEQYQMTTKCNKAWNCVHNSWETV